MLILSRRATEKILFPSLGITVHLLRINGRVAKIGIDAPPRISVRRDEVTESGSPVLADPTHEICNRLSKVTLALHLFDRQRTAGQLDAAEATLGRVFDALTALDRDAIFGLVHGESPEPLPPVATMTRLRSLRALLVEDDSNERELLAGLLRMNGCECSTAADGTEALQFLHENRPDVVLLDMVMPHCDGPTTLRAIRSQPSLAGLCVFGVSGSSQRELGVATGPSGVDAWFAKPLNPRTLWSAVLKCVDSN